LFILKLFWLILNKTSLFEFLFKEMLISTQEKILLK